MKIPDESLGFLFVVKINNITVYIIENNVL